MEVEIMANICLELYAKKIDYSSEHFNSEQELIRAYQFSSESILEKDLQKLIYQIKCTKNDGFNLDYEFTEHDYYIRFIFFFGKNLTNEDQEIISDIVNECEKLIKNNQIELELVFKEYGQCFGEEEGFILGVSQDDIIISHNDVEEALTDNNINYRLIDVCYSEYEHGCGAGTESFILFIKASIESGITWDLIKAILSVKIGEFGEYVKLNLLDNLRFKKLRKMAADRIREDEKYLVLTDFNRDQEKNMISISFKCKRKKINMVCDNDYNIESFYLS